MTAPDPTAKRYVLRKGGYKNRTFSMSRHVVDQLRYHPGVNWSAVVDNYLKVYLYDLEQQKEQK